jgi:hypothetical protein
MQKSFDYQLNMHSEVLGVCNRNHDLLAIILAYVAAKLKVDQDNANETELAFRLEKLGKNSAIPKNLSRTAASKAFFDLSSNLSSFFWIKGDMKMYLEVKFTESSLKKTSDNEFVRICGNLLVVAQDYLEQLADRNITEQTLADDGALLENFVSEKQVFIDTRRERFEVIAQLNKQIKTTNFDLKAIDSIVDSLSVSQPVLAGDYWKARDIRKTAGSKIVLKGKVYDSVTNQPLPGAVMSIVRTDSLKALASAPELVKTVKIKSAGGGFQLKSLPAGNYQVTVTYYGYNDQQITASVNEGVLTTVQLPLSKIA